MSTQYTDSSTFVDTSILHGTLVMEVGETMLENTSGSVNVNPPSANDGPQRSAVSRMLRCTYGSTNACGSQLVM